MQSSAKNPTPFKGGSVKERNCYECVHLEFPYCPVINHLIENGFAMICHAEKCKSYKKKVKK